MANKINIEFGYDAKNYKGYFTAVAGAGSSSVWHLFDQKNYFLGRLRQQRGGWVFDDSKPERKLSILAEYFANYLIAWYQ